MSRPFDHRNAPLDMTPEEFRVMAHALIDKMAVFYDRLPERPISGRVPSESLRESMTGQLPEEGLPSAALFDAASALALDNLSTSSHPRHWAYITGAASPYAVLGTLLQTSVNTNAVRPVGVHAEIENRVLAWLAELVGYPRASGILVSGGTEANIIALACARTRRLGPSYRIDGMGTPEAAKLRIYASRSVHPWLLKACTLLGFGLNAIHWVDDPAGDSISPSLLSERIEGDRAAGLTPFFAVGTAGIVSTGAVDPLPELAEVCAANDVWFHVDGSYGAPAIACPDSPAELAGLRAASSLALDPHKWFYIPLDAGCVLMQDPTILHETFRMDADFFATDPSRVGSAHWNELGIEGSRPFRALKIWICLLRAGRSGYARMIADDMKLAAYLHELVKIAPDLEPVTQHLSITTFRYVPPDRREESDRYKSYLNRLNSEIIQTLRTGGNALCSHLERDSVMLLRVCIVNFRTGPEDIEAFVELVRSTGAEIDAHLREALKDP
jgi:aromatic-L-amino-acid/L-tryptophan decarboxylase